jgi:glycosyltransferase involved in cell wall biosynthesis
MNPPAVPPGGACPISAVIITRDAAAHLAEVLAAVEFCGERLVLDSGSTDDTIAIARAAGARVEHQPFLGYGPQKCRAVALAAHDWILAVDADEVLDDEARAAMATLALTDPQASYAVRRRTFIGRREVRHGAWGNDLVVRLFNRTTAGFRPLPVHEAVESGSPPRRLPGTILHYSYPDSAAVLARAVVYARLKAAVMRRKGQRAGAWSLPARAVAVFAGSYFLRGGWRDGAAGFVVALARVIDSTLPRVILLLDVPAVTPEAPANAASE